MLIVIWIIICIILWLVYGYISNFILVTKEYHISIPEDKDMDSMDICVLSDLHGVQWGKDSQKLVEKVKNLSPQYILIAGDMFNKKGQGMEMTLALCKSLQKVAPVFYAPGNHELRYDQSNNQEFGNKIRETGVYYLENESVTLENVGIVISGLSLPEEKYDKVWKKRTLSTYEMNQMIPDTQKKSYYKILLAHHPVFARTYWEYGSNMVLSGHLHGGIMRLPWGGAISPTFRIFPQYVHGLYGKTGHQMIVSAGLGNHHIRLRFFNQPELVVVHFEKSLPNE